MKKSSLFFLCAFLVFPSFLSAQAPPSSYNLNSFDWLTPVKNQGQLGTCWAFSNITTFESALLRQGIVDSPFSPRLDLSVWHLATANGNITDLTPNRQGAYDGWGGENEFAIGYWTRGRGQWVMKPSAGTTPAGGGSVMTDNNPNNAYPSQAVAQKRNLAPFVPPASQEQSEFLLSQSVNFLWNRNIDDLPAYQDSLKEAVMKYGPLSVYVKADNDQTDRRNPVWYATGDVDSDHAVTLAGWNDSQELTFGDLSFTGGWYIQNSWGTGLGFVDPVTEEGGYYWVPFADTSTANVKYATAYVPRLRTNPDTGITIAPTVIQNQIFAPVDSEVFGVDRRGFQAGTTTLAAQRQFVPSNSLLGAVGLFQVEGNTSVDLSIYENFNPQNGPQGNQFSPKRE